MDGAVATSGVSDGNGQRGARTGNQHDDGPGDGVSGERSAGHRDTGGKLAIVYDSKRPVGSGREYDGGDCAGWICERESGSEPGSDAGRTVLHSSLLPERRHNNHRILGCASGGGGDPGAGAGAVDAVGASCSGGEQGVCGPGDCRCIGEPADGVRRDVERSTYLERGSDATLAGGRQALCG